MIEDVAVQIFAAENGLEDQEVAKATMFQHGLADYYIARAERLEPIFKSAYYDGFGVGLKAYDELVREIKVEDASYLTPGFREGVQAVIIAYNHVFDTILSEGMRALNDEQNGVVDEANEHDEMLGLLKAIFGPNVRVETAR